MNKKNRVSISRMQQCIRELIKEEGLDIDSDDEDDENPPEHSEDQPKRGRKKIPERWTRVISIHSDDLNDIRTFELGPELLLDAGMGDTG